MPIIVEGKWFLVAGLQLKSRRTEVSISRSFKMCLSRLSCRCERISTMKTLKSIAAVIVLLALAFLAMGATGHNHFSNDPIAQLKARIRSLEQRVEGLEKKLQTSTAKRTPAIRRPPSPPRDQSIPRGWRRREFNGIPYYLVPLSQKQSRSSRGTSPGTRP